MSDTSSSTAPRLRRAQFTIRTFFAAAVLVSCFGVAAHLPGEAAKAIGLTFLASLTFAGLYWTFRGTGPLVALPVGTAVALIVQGLAFPFIDGMHLKDIWLVVVTSFVWGIAFSVVVVLSRLLWHLTRWLAGWLKRRPDEELPSDRNAILVIRPSSYVKYVVLTCLLLAMFIVLAAFVLACYSKDALFVPFVLSMCLDLPLFQLAVEIHGPIGPTYSSTSEIIGFIALTSVVACPLHAGSNWIVGWLVARIDRRTSLPSELASEGEGRGGEEASVNLTPNPDVRSDEPQNIEQGTAE